MHWKRAEEKYIMEVSKKVHHQKRVKEEDRKDEGKGKMHQMWGPEKDR